MFKLILRCKTSDFTGRLSLKLKTPLILKGQWEVAVTHLEINKNCAWLVLCDLVDFTFVGDERMRLLEFYGTRTEAQYSYSPNLTYVAVIKNVIESINVDVVSVENQQENTNNNDSKGDTLCVLHFRKS